MNSRQQRILAAGVAAACTWMAQADAAGTHTLTVSASVQGKCTFSSASSSMSVITVDPSAAGPFTGTQSVTYKCTKGTSATMSAASQSTASSAGGNLIKSASEALAYAFSNSGGGTGTGFGNAASNTLSLDVSVTITAAAAQDANAGTYTDTINITVTP